VKAGIVLVCRKPRETCTDHYVRLFRIIDEFRLPVTIWDCNPGDEKLDSCQKIDMPPSVTGPKLSTIAVLAALVVLLAGLVVLNGRRIHKPPVPPQNRSFPEAV
jgi:hypothetical protein